MRCREQKYLTLSWLLKSKSHFTMSLHEKKISYLIRHVIKENNKQQKEASTIGLSLDESRSCMEGHETLSQNGVTEGPTINMH